MSTPSWIGKKLNGRYEIQDLLGQGGMSSVYRANDPNLSRIVAIKLIHQHLSNDPNFVRRFEVEAASVAQLRHPNIIQVYDFASDDDTYFMVLEFVPGETLEEHLKRLEKEGRRMPIDEVIKYTANVCDALQYAHDRGLIHRDIKPANIMLSVQGEAILMDFGIAKIVGGTQHTATGAVVGTALYMAPEIIMGEPADHRVDIYSLGVTLFEALAGKPPYQADSAMSLLMMHVNDPIPDVKELNPDVPQALIAVVEKALAKNKNDRFQSAGEFAKALRAIDLSKPDEVPAQAGVQKTAIEEMPLANSMAGTLVEEPDSLPRPQDARPVQRQTPPPQSPPPSRPAASARPAKSSGGSTLFGLSLPVVIGGGVIGLFILVGMIFFALKGFGTAAAPTPTNTQPPTLAATATLEEVVAPTATLAPTNTPEPTFTPTATDPAGPYVRINSIMIQNGYYIVEYETFDYTEQLPGVHIHFFFNNITPENAGAGGSGPWYLWGGPRPFDGYAVTDRPADATQMCALQANANHTINLNTGNCVDLPSE